MRKRRTKKQQRQLENRVALFILLVAVATFRLTGSLIVTGILAFISVLLILAIVIYQNNKRKERLSSSGIVEIDSMDGIEFEYYLKELFQSKGYSA